MRTFFQEAFAFAQRLAYQPNVPMFEVAQTSMDNACSAAGGAAGKIVLFCQQYTAPAKRSLTCDGDTIYPATNAGDVKMGTFDPLPHWT